MSSGVPAPVNYASVAIPPAIPDFFSASLKQSEYHRQTHNDNRQQIHNVRKDAEALFRPKPRVIEPSLPADPFPAGAPVRKPRILSALALPVTRMVTEA